MSLFWIKTTSFCLNKQDTIKMIMLKRLFSKLKGKQDETSNDVNAYKESEGKKPEGLEK